MSNIPLKFTATNVDQIEKKNGTSIENLLGDMRIDHLRYFIEKAYHNEESDRVGCSNQQALEYLETYLGDGGEKEELLVDIMEALQTGGFLSRKIDLKAVRASLTTAENKIKEALDQIKAEK